MSAISKNHTAVTQAKEGLKRRDLLLSTSALVALARATGYGVPGLRAKFSQGMAQRRRECPPPNIIYIVSDDQGWKDVGFHGSDIKTRTSTVWRKRARN